MKKLLPLVMLLASVSLSVPAMAEPVAPASEKEVVKEHKGKKGKKHHKGAKGEHKGKMAKNHQPQPAAPQHAQRSYSNMQPSLETPKTGKVWLPSMSRGFQH